jgi:hypothetical protein
MASHSSTPQTLQHTVENSFDPGSSSSTKKKRKQRVNPEDGQPEQHGKKKRRKSNQTSRDQPTIQTQEPLIDSTSHASGPASGALANKTRKKKSKKGKQRADAASALSTQDDPSALHSETQTPQQFPASTAAFLSALVAAASATADHLPVQAQPDSQTQSDFDNVFPPHFPSQIPPCVPVTTQPFQCPLPPHFADQANTFFPGILGGPSLPELASHANEEIMRYLHDVDITKLQSVLRTLGEAAASAHWPQESVPPQQGFVPTAQPLPQTPPVKQNPIPSYAILGQLPKSVEPPRPPVWEQYGNPAHAELLATKWMNASKLAEMVKNEGNLIERLSTSSHASCLVGLVYHKGKFSEIEQTQLKNALETYRTVSRTRGVKLTTKIVIRGMDYLRNS